MSLNEAGREPGCKIIGNRNQTASLNKGKAAGFAFFWNTHVEFSILHRIGSSKKTLLRENLPATRIKSAHKENTSCGNSRASVTAASIAPTGPGSAGDIKCRCGENHRHYRPHNLH